MLLKMTKQVSAKVMASRLVKQWFRDGETRKKRLLRHFEYGKKFEKKGLLQF